MEPLDLNAIAQGELSADERLVWLGQPSPFVLARKRTGMILPGLFLMLLAITFLTVPTVTIFEKPGTVPFPFLIVFPVIGVIALGFGLAMLASPLLQWRLAGRTIYAVTDQRVLIIDPGSVQSFEPGDIQQLVRRDRGGGRGDLVFREEQGNLMLAMYTFGNNATRRIGFFGIPDPRAAEEAVRQLKRSVG